MPGNFRAAGMATVGLGMESPVGRIMVFTPARLTHGKRLHGSLRPVIGDRFYNAEPGAAVRAVDKGIGIASVSAVIQFGQTLPAKSNVRRDRCGGLSAAAAGDDGKTGRYFIGGKKMFRNRCDGRERRRIIGEGIQKFFNIGIFADYANYYTTFRIADRTRKGETDGKVIDKGSKPDALNCAADEDFDPFLFMPYV
jgi:hypothetical protein